MVVAAGIKNAETMAMIAITASISKSVKAEDHAERRGQILIGGGLHHPYFEKAPFSSAESRGLTNRSNSKNAGIRFRIRARKQRGVPAAYGLT